MSRIIFVTGGCRSGKSGFAVRFAAQAAASVAMLVTCIAADEEMESRVAKHRASRPPDWPVYEAPYDVCAVLETISEEAVVFDCFPTWIANWLVRNEPLESIESRIVELVHRIQVLPEKTVVVVSAEVGMSVVPESLLGRQFRDLVGLANQRLAAIANEAYLLVSGIPLELKRLSGETRMREKE